MRRAKPMMLMALAAFMTAAASAPDLDALLAQAAAGGTHAPAAIAAATAEAARAGLRDPAREADARMRLAETLMLSDPPAAAAMMTAARAAAVRAAGEASARVALADYRLALVRALGGDRAGQLVPMAAAAERLAARAATPQERTHAAQALIVTASFAMSSGLAALTERTRDAALALLARPDLRRDADHAEAMRVAADVFVFQHRPADALVWADRSVAAYEALGDDNPAIINALARRGSVLQRLSRYPEALASLRRAVALADRGTGGDPTLTMLPLRALAFYYARVGEPDLALPLFKRALAEVETLPPGFPYAAGLTRDIMQTLLDADRWEEARGYAEETATRTRATLGPDSYEHAAALLVLARIDTRLVRYDAAAARIDTAEAIVGRALVAGSKRGWEPLAARGALLAAQGRGVEAAGYFDRAGTYLAEMPVDDPDRIDLAADGAGALLGSGRATEASWRAARAAAEGLTTRLVRQAATQGSVDAEQGRTARVFGTALDVAWARAQAGEQR